MLIIQLNVECNKNFRGQKHKRQKSYKEQWEKDPEDLHSPTHHGPFDFNFWMLFLTAIHHKKMLYISKIFFNVSKLDP
jgi:hypothetical protein